MEACDNMVQVTKVVEPSIDANRQYSKSYQKYLANNEYLNDDEGMTGLRRPEQAGSAMPHSGSCK